MWFKEIHKESTRKYWNRIIGQTRKNTRKMIRFKLSSYLGYSYPSKYDNFINTNIKYLNQSKYKNGYWMEYKELNIL